MGWHALLYVSWACSLFVLRCGNNEQIYWWFLFFFFCVFLPVLEYDLVDIHLLVEYRARTEKNGTRKKTKKTLESVLEGKRKQKERKANTQRDIIWDICFFSGAIKAEEK